MLPPNLRVIVHQAGDPAWNMAVDEALLLHVADPVLRFYEWNQPAWTIGYFQPASDVPDDRPYIRRYTGGGLVDHREDITYSITTRRDHPLARQGTAGSYQSVHEGIARALRRTGLDIIVANHCADLQDPACFRKPVRYDLLLNGQKCAGAAQRRNRQGCLHQGSILLPSPVPRPEIQQALLQELQPLLGVTTLISNLLEDENNTAEQLTQERYATPEWNDAH